MLYRVHASFEILVWAKDEREAQDLARSHVEDEAHNGIYSTVQITDPARIPREWRGALPYGEGVEDRTCEDLLDSLATEQTGEDK